MAIGSASEQVRISGVAKVVTDWESVMVQSMTGPGRPGRERQASLVAMAAAVLGWTYPMLLQRVLPTTRPLNELRKITPEL